MYYTNIKLFLTLYTLVLASTGEHVGLFSYIEGYRIVVDGRAVHLTEIYSKSNLRVSAGH